MFPYSELARLIQSDIGDYDKKALEAFNAPFVSSDMDIVQARCCSLGNSLYKKLSPGGLISKDLEKRSLDKFLRFNRKIRPEDWSFNASDEVDSWFWDLFRENFQKLLDFDDSAEVNLDLQYLAGKLATGPGSAIGADSDCFYTKLFGSKLTVSSEHLLSLYRAAIYGNTCWQEAERLRNQQFGTQVVGFNKLFFVLKTQEELRTCANECSIDMLFQQAISAYILARVERAFGITLKSQPTYNRELARLGSIDGSFGTIDLRSASDSISWALVRAIAPNNLLGWIRLTRAESTFLPNGELEKLNMVSTMGNGYTFALQIAIFACVVRSVYQLKNLSSADPRKDFGVFGDDIVVRREAYDAVVKYLHLLGFEVNTSKSFNSGAFRESCGHDWYQGHYIRGTYIRSLETLPEVYSAINRLNRWSALSGVPIRSAIAFLRGFCPRKAHMVPPSEQPDSGIQVPFDLTHPKVDNRYWFSYRKLMAKARKREIPKAEADFRALGWSFYSEYALGVCYLGGFVQPPKDSLHPKLFDPSGNRLERDEPRYINMRTYPGEKPLMHVVRDSIPYWDWAGPDLTDFCKVTGISYSDWKTAVAANG